MTLPTFVLQTLVVKFVRQSESEENVLLVMVCTIVIPRSGYIFLGCYLVGPQGSCVVIIMSYIMFYTLNIRILETISMAF